ncbi:hypothetical protein B0H11DRAFT_2192318 [Mycena galericulata]|nr:hypothetical protein B0H11DRAFT_2192318 [Mycena galericulata]
MRTSRGGSPPASMVAVRELGSVPSRGAGYWMRSRGRFRAQRVLDPVALLEFERSHLEFLRVVASVTLLIIPHDAHDQQILEPSQVYVHGRSADARLWYPRRARSSSFHGNFHVGRWDGALLPRWQTSVKFALTRAGLRVMHVVQPEGSWPSATSIPEGVFVYLAFQLLIPEEEEGEVICLRICSKTSYNQTQDDFGEKGCHRRAKLGCEDTVQMCREATVTVTRQFTKALVGNLDFGCPNWRRSRSPATSSRRLRSGCLLYPEPKGERETSGISGCGRKSGTSGRRPEVLLSAVLATPQLGRTEEEWGIGDSGGNHVTPDGAGQVPEGVQSDPEDAGNNRRNAGGSGQAPLEPNTM